MVAARGDGGRLTRSLRDTSISSTSNSPSELPAHQLTVGAVARDLGALKALDERLEASGVEPGSLIVLSRRRDERLIGVTLPEARTRRVESGLTRMQWFEFASAFLGVTA